ncbi:MAG: GHKL domain-containing protein [Flavobacteriales bacterium]|nr:GHKL domain-containing protein [Flavobacteriales bacterium]
MFKSYINLDSVSLTKRIFFFMLLLLVITLVTAVLLVFYDNKESIEENRIARLSEKENQISESFIYLLTSYDINSQNAIPEIEKRLFEISDINDTQLNVYDIQGNLQLTTEGEDNVRHKKLSEELLKKLKTNKYVVIRYEGKTEEESFLANYFYVHNYLNEPVAIVNIPYFYDDYKARKDFDRLLMKFLLLLLFLIIGSGIIAWFFSNSITRKLKNVAEKIKTTQVLESNEKIQYDADDEVKVLVSAYNDMVDEITKQKRMLQVVERDSAWKEMAKQVAHEVRNPLTPMSLMVQDFRRKFDSNDPDIKQKVDNLCSSLTQQIEVISSISNSFSDFAKLPDRDDKMIDLIEETKNIIRVFGEDILFTSSNDEIFYLIDEVYYNRVITNLLKNAFQAVEEGVEAIVLVDIQGIGKEVVIRVKDNGCGISKELLTRIFEPKFTTKSSGMGLGLPMVNKIIQEYGGSIICKSKVGEGSEFVIELPKK